MDDRRIRIGAVRAAGLAAMVVLSGCSIVSGDDGAARRVLPPALAACDTGDGVDPQECFDAIAAELERLTLLTAGGDPVTRAAFVEAYDDVVELGAGGAVADSGFQDTGISLDAGDLATSTEPIGTRWAIGLHETVLWACFSGADVTVGPSECAG